MTDDRRNPYVVLGVPYGVSIDEAQRAFARRAREARWGDADAIDLSDLTWALERIEAHAVEPAAGYGTYRIPAVPGQLDAPTGFGLLRPAPRPAPRQAPLTEQAERNVVFDAARLDAAQQLLDRTAAAAGRRLEHVAEAPVPTISVPVPPVRRRGWGPVALVGAICVGVFAVAGGRALLDSDDAPADSVVTSTSAASTTVVTDDATTTSSSSPPAPDLPGFGDRLERSGIGVTPDDPVDAFGHVCIVFTIDGDESLGFVRSRVALITGGIVVSPALDITTGRADITDVFGDPSPATREVCFASVDWQERTTYLEYATDAGNSRWLIADPANDPADG